MPNAATSALLYPELPEIGHPVRWPKSKRGLRQTNETKWGDEKNAESDGN
jgi:hypothetical protein